MTHELVRESLTPDRSGWGSEPVVPYTPEENDAAAAALGLPPRISVGGRMETWAEWAVRTEVERGVGSSAPKDEGQLGG